jgi:hypothetical protein
LLGVGSGADGLERFSGRDLVGTAGPESARAFMNGAPRDTEGWRYGFVRPPEEDGCRNSDGEEGSLRECEDDLGCTTGTRSMLVVPTDDGIMGVCDIGCAYAFWRATGRVVGSRGQEINFVTRVTQAHVMWYLPVI